MYWVVVVRPSTSAVSEVERMRLERILHHHDLYQGINSKQRFVAGIVTTWSREKVRHNAPMVKNAALLKAIVEGSLFCYMVPFNIVVAYWICTTPGPSAWARAIKILLSAPGMFFQFGWYMACRQFWKELQKGHGGTSSPVWISCLP